MAFSPGCGIFLRSTWIFSRAEKQLLFEIIAPGGSKRSSPIKDRPERTSETRARRGKLYEALRAAFVLLLLLRMTSVSESSSSAKLRRRWKNCQGKEIQLGKRGKQKGTRNQTRRERGVNLVAADLVRLARSIFIIMSEGGRNPKIGRRFSRLFSTGRDFFLFMKFFHVCPKLMLEWITEPVVQHHCTLNNIYWSIEELLSLGMHNFQKTVAE